MFTEQGFGDTLQFVRFVPRLAEWSGQRLALASSSQPALNKAAALLLASGYVAELDFERTEIEEIVRRIYVKAKP